MQEIATAMPIDIHRGDPDRATLSGMMRDADIVLNGHTYLDADLIAAAEHLSGIVFLGSGASSYVDMDAAKARGIPVRTISNYGDAAVAQHTLALVLDAVRHVSRMDRDLRRGTWRTLEGREFGELTLGVVGLGGIGRCFADLAARVGFKVVAWNRSPVEPPGEVDMVPLDTLLAQSDIVSLHLGYGAETAGFLDAGKLMQLRKGAILVNTARAGLVDTRARIVALDAGHLGHAALDVFDHEPLDPAAPLVQRDDTTLTAHAGFKTGSATRRLLEQALEETRILLAEAQAT
jgi:D-3-phosphoglycerate dehydrogenase / 2-oxoglutarate reductase